MRAAVPVSGVPRAWAIVPVPCDATTAFGIVGLVAKQWQVEHPGRTMSMMHLETRTTEFGQALVIWDEPPAG